MGTVPVLHVCHVCSTQFYIFYLLSAVCILIDATGVATGVAHVFVVCLLLHVCESLYVCHVRDDVYVKCICITFQGNFYECMNVKLHTDLHSMNVSECVFVQFYFCRFISVTFMASISCMYYLKIVHFSRMRVLV